MRAPHSWPTHLPKAPLPNTVTLDIKISTCIVQGRGPKHSVYPIGSGLFITQVWLPLGRLTKPFLSEPPVLMRLKDPLHDHGVSINWS